MQKIRIKFEKGPEVRFISHLDMIRAIERAVRRSGIPIAYSSGYNPRPRIAWGPPLPLGIESNCELADLTMERWIKPETIAEALGSELPGGLNLIEAGIGNPKEPSLDSHMNRAEYIVLLSSGNKERLRERISKIKESSEIPVDKKGMTVNKRSMLHGLELTEEPLGIRMKLQVGGGGTLKPKEVLDLMEDLEIQNIKRTGLYFEEMTSVA